MAHGSTTRLLRRLLRRSATGGAAAPAGRGLTRRGLLRRAGALGAGALAARALPAASQPAMRVAVVGAGLAGLTAAEALVRAGVDATVYEARPRVGGRVFSGAPFGDGRVTDYGGQFVNSDHEDMLALAGRLGIPLVRRDAEGGPTDAPAAAFVFGGRRVPEAEVAAALGPVAAVLADLDRALAEDWDAEAPALDALSAAAWLDRAAPHPLARALLEATIRTEYGVEPEASSALQLVYNLAAVEDGRAEPLGASDEAFVVEGGSQRLAQALADRMPGRILTDHPLRRLERAGGAWRLSFGDGRTAEADAVVVAIPFPVLRTVELAADLPPTLVRMIAELDLGRNEKVLCAASSRAWRTAGGFSREVWADRPFAGGWDAGVNAPGRADGLLCALLGGAQALDGRGAEARGLDALAAFDLAAPGTAAAAEARFHATAWADDPWTRGAYTTFRPGQVTAFADTAWRDGGGPEDQTEVRVGGLLFAGEHLSLDWYGYMNGAVETGRLAAASLLRDPVAPGKAER
jgi:monoamine oxidase